MESGFETVVADDVPPLVAAFAAGWPLETPNPRGLIPSDALLATSDPLLLGVNDGTENESMFGKVPLLTGLPLESVVFVVVLVLVAVPPCDKGFVSVVVVEGAVVDVAASVVVFVVVPPNPPRPNPKVGFGVVDAELVRLEPREKPPVEVEAAGVPRVSVGLFSVVEADVVVLPPKLNKPPPNDGCVAVVVIVVVEPASVLAGVPKRFVVVLVVALKRPLNEGVVDDWAGLAPKLNNEPLDWVEAKPVEACEFEAVVFPPTSPCKFGTVVLVGRAEVVVEPPKLNPVDKGVVVVVLAVPRFKPPPPLVEIDEPEPNPPLPPPPPPPPTVVEPPPKLKPELGGFVVVVVEVVTDWVVDKAAPNKLFDDVPVDGWFKEKVLAGVVVVVAAGVEAPKLKPPVVAGLLPPNENKLLLLPVLLVADAPKLNAGVADVVVVAAFGANEFVDADPNRFVELAGFGAPKRDVAGEDVVPDDAPKLNGVLAWLLLLLDAGVDVPKLNIFFLIFMILISKFK
jgi:hypothetical protein